MIHYILGRPVHHVIMGNSVHAKQAKGRGFENGQDIQGWNYDAPDNLGEHFDTFYSLRRRVILGLTV